MGNQILVSIIVVTYNSEKFVEETLESVYNQDYNNIELIVSDDCSSDGTLQLCRRWEETHKNRFSEVKILQTPNNRGICGNYNFALQHATGKYIKYIAGDDVLYRHCISRFVTEAEATGRKILYSALTPFSTVDREVVDKPTRNGGKYCFETQNPKEQMRRMLDKVYGAVEGPTVFVDRQQFSLMGGGRREISNAGRYSYGYDVCKQGICYRIY